MALDATFKQLVTDWQVKLIDGKRVPNDHADAAHDDAVRARLADFHPVVATLLPDILALTGRLKPFPKRLGRAAAAVASGDGTMIASPLKDSYHTIWFELHEELIHLAGRSFGSGTDLPVAPPAIVATGHAKCICTGFQPRNSG